MYVQSALKSKLQNAFISAGGGVKRGYVIKNKLLRQPFGMTFLFTSPPPPSGASSGVSCSICNCHSYSDFSRKSTGTSFSAELNSLSLDVERSSNPGFKHIFCRWFPSYKLCWNTKASWITLTHLRSFGTCPTQCSMIKMIPHSSLFSFFISFLSSHPLS